MFAYQYLFALLLLFEGKQAQAKGPECENAKLKCSRSDWMSQDKKKCIFLSVEYYLIDGDKARASCTYTVYAGSAEGSLLTIEDEETNKLAKQRLKDDNNKPTSAFIDVFPAIHKWGHFSDWKTGQPILVPGQELLPCGVVTSDGWVVVNCNVRNRFFCEYPTSGRLSTMTNATIKNWEYWTLGLTSVPVRERMEFAINESIEVTCVANGSRPLDQIDLYWVVREEAMPSPLSKESAYYSKVDENARIPLSYGYITKKVEKSSRKDNICVYTTTLTAKFRFNTLMSTKYIACLLHDKIAYLPRQMNENYAGLQILKSSPDAGYIKFGVRVPVGSSRPVMEIKYHMSPNYMYGGTPFTITCKHMSDFVGGTAEARTRLDLEFLNFTDDPTIGRPPVYTEEHIYDRLTSFRKRTLHVKSVDRTNNNAIVICRSILPDAGDPLPSQSKCMRDDNCVSQTIRVWYPRKPPKLTVFYDDPSSGMSYTGSWIDATCSGNVGVGTSEKLTLVVVHHDKTLFLHPEKVNGLNVKIITDIKHSKKAGDTWTTNVTLQSLSKYHMGLQLLCFSGTEHIPDDIKKCPTDDAFCAQSMELRIEDPVSFGVTAPFRAKWKKKAIVRLLMLFVLGGLVLLAFLIALIILGARHVIRKRKQETSESEESDTKNISGAKNTKSPNRGSKAGSQGTAASSVGKNSAPGGKSPTLLSLGKATSIKDGKSATTIVYEEIDRQGNVQTVTETII